MQNYMLVISDDEPDKTHLTEVIWLEDDDIVMSKDEKTKCGIPCMGWRLPYGVFKVMPEKDWFDKVTCFKCYIR